MVAECAEGTTVEKEFSVSREYKAPIDVVFKAFTSADDLAKWWGPKGFTMKVCKINLEPGGAFHYCMQAPSGGMEMWGKWLLQEIEAPKSLKFVSGFSDEKGNWTRHPMCAEWPLEVGNILTLTEKNGVTTVLLRGKPQNASQAECDVFNGAHEQMRQGFRGTLDQLEEFLGTVA